MSAPTPLHEPAPMHYGDPAAEYRSARDGAAVFDLSPRGKVQVTGPDAAAFLHNLCTNDIKGLPDGGGCEVFFANARARALAHGLAYRHRLAEGGDSFWLDVPAGLGERLLRHLDHYLVSEQVELADRTRELAQLHLAGPRVEAVLQAVAAGPLPGPEPLRHAALTWGEDGKVFVRRHAPLGLPGFDVLVSPEQAPALWAALLQAGAAPAGSLAYEILRVEAGTPSYGPDIDEERFVVEVGRKQAISYAKGCYLGQEPVVMARDRGQVNRTLLGLKVAGAGAVPRGSRLFRDGQEVGATASSVESPDLGTLALAYVRRGHQEPGTAVEIDVGEGRRPAEVVPLPFRAD